MIYLAIGLALAFVLFLLYAACVMGGRADDALEAERRIVIGRALTDCEAGETGEVLLPIRLDEAMLLTWDEICNLPEVWP